MAGLADVPDDWELWNEDEDGRVVLVYRPDVFDSSAFPAPCIPTAYVTHGRRTRRPGRNPNDRTGRTDWYLTLTLEPDVTLASPDRFETRESALDAAAVVTTRFADGQLDYRDAYQVPREEYLSKLDELTGRPSSPDEPN